MAQPRFLWYNGKKWLVKPYVSNYTSDNYNTFDETRFIKGIFYAKNKKKKMSGMWFFEHTKMGQTERTSTL